MILCVCLELVYVDGWKARDEELQLLLSEDGHQFLRDDVIEALQECIQLLPDGTCHFHLTHKFNILSFVLISDQRVGAIRYEFSSFCHTKLLDLVMVIGE